MFLADLHIHSQYSDGKLSIPEIVDLYGKLGFGAIAITDHICETNGIFGAGAKYLDWTVRADNFKNYIDEINSEAERAWAHYRMLVIPGYEITKNSILPSQSAHFLVIGSETFMCPNQDTVAQLSQAKNSGALTIAAHPVNTGVREKQTYRLWNLRDKVGKYVDAWEVASGAVWFREVDESGLPIIANSDLHLPSHIQSWKTVFNCERSREAIFEAIRKQNIEFKFFHMSELLKRYSVNRFGNNVRVG